MDVKDTVSTGDDFSAYDAGYKIFTGYNFGKIPLLDLAVEGSYVISGEMSDEINGVDVTYEQSSFNRATYLRLNILSIPGLMTI